MNYSNIIYAFDIETTTNENHITSHYLSNFVSVDFGLLRNEPAEILDNISAPFFCRTADDVNDFLIKLNNKAEKQNTKFLIFVHNFSYEFDFLIKNVKFFYENFKNENALFIKSRIPLFVKIENLEFRCSYKLLNKSLKRLGDELNYPKKEIDYKTEYYSFSDLPQIEYDYNERDTRLTLFAILQECKKWEWIKSTKDIPLTSTGFTRKNNLKINSRENTRTFASICKYQKELTIEQINFLEKCFSGGYNHCNPLFYAKPLQNCASFDIISSYIDTILHRYYPHNFKKCQSNELAFFNRICKNNNGSFFDKIKNYQNPFEISFLATLTLENVKVKKLRNDNVILPISASKCDELKSFTLDNGRIYSAESLTICCNEVDFFIFQQFYDFTVKNVYNLYYTTSHSTIGDYVITATKKYLQEKSTLKFVIHKLKKAGEITVDDFICTKTNKLIYDKQFIVNLLQNSNMPELLDGLYRESKSKLNAQYGINVQKLLNPLIEYDREVDDFIVTQATKIESKRLLRDFISGIYITAYSRLNLFCFGLFLINNTNSVLVYSDTDSWKVWGDLENAIKYCNEYNKIIEQYVHNSENYNIGYFDFEDEKIINNFCSLGCKKYIVDEDKEIISTIAGINKKQTSTALTELYKSLDYDFNLLCDIAFSPSTVFDYSVTKKLSSKYNNNEYNETVTDCNGKSGIIKGKNMVELCETDFTLMNNDSKSVNAYIRHCELLQNKNFNIIPTLIYRDKNGKISYKYLENLDNLRLYKTQDHNFDDFMN